MANASNKCYILISYLRFRWEINNDEGAIDDWGPCLGTPSYGSNISNSISLTAPSTGSAGTYDYTLSCISVQYFDQSGNDTLESKFDIEIHVIEEEEKGSNITVYKILNNMLKSYHYVK